MLIVSASASSQDRVTETRFTLPLETSFKEANADNSIFQDIRSQAVKECWSLKNETDEVSFLIAPSLLLGGSLQAVMQN